MQFAAALSDKRGDHLTMNENLKTNMKRRRMIKENITAYLFLSPTLVFYIIFTAVPLIMTIFILSFSEFSLLKPIEFVGLANFRQLFEDPDFRTVMLNTVKFVLIIAPVHIIGGMVLAIGKFYQIPLFSGCVPHFILFSAGRDHLGDRDRMGISL